MRLRAVPSLLILGSFLTGASANSAQPPKPLTGDRYDCQSQTPGFPNRADVSLAEALKLVQQRQDRWFVYHCSPTAKSTTQSISAQATAVTGVVTYRQRIALPPNAVVEVKLLDVSRADAPADTIAEQTISTNGQQVPIPFNLPYEASQIQSRNHYAVAARILVDGKLRWISTRRYAVLTFGHPSQVEVMVEPVTTQPAANRDRPADPTHIKTSGWGSWQPIDQMEKANIDSGFSNMELGGYLDFQNACAQATGQPTDTFPNWFRLSNLVNQIGTGQVEYGCWVKDQFITTFSSTAVKRDTKQPYCLQVIAKTPINVYKQPQSTAEQIRILRSRDTVQPGTLPANVMTVDGTNWIQIQSPVEGWVMQGPPEAPGNLRLCP